MNFLTKQRIGWGLWLVGVSPLVSFFFGYHLLWLPVLYLFLISLSCIVSGIALLKKPSVGRAFSLLFGFVAIIMIGTRTLFYQADKDNLEEARLAATKQQLSNFSQALEAFRADVRRYPTQDEGLAALTQPSGSVSRWRGPYYPGDIPLDPWGHHYIYMIPGKHDADKYDLSSMGPDGLSGTADDIVNWPTKEAIKN